MVSDRSVGVLKLTVHLLPALPSLQGSVLKKIVEAIKDLVNEANLECTSSGVQLQARGSLFCPLVMW